MHELNRREFPSSSFPVVVALAFGEVFAKEAKRSAVVEVRSSKWRGLGTNGRAVMNEIMS